MTAEVQREASQTPPAPAGGPLPARRVPRDLRTPIRWMAALVMPIGPICIAVLRFILPYNTLDSSAGMVTKIVAEPGRESAVLWLTFVATFTLLPGIFVAVYLARRSAPILATITGVLLGLAYLGNWAVAVGDVIADTATAPGTDPSAVAHVLDAVNNSPVVSLLSSLFVIGHILGTIMLGIAWWRARVAGLAVAIMLAISQPLHLAAALTGNHPLDLLGWGLTGVALAYGSVVVLRMRNSDWDLPPVPAAATGSRAGRGPSSTRPS